jgi:hypothetical protein
MKLPDDVKEMFKKAGSKGGKRRRKVLTAEQRKASGRKAARARWAKGRGRSGPQK